MPRTLTAQQVRSLPLQPNVDPLLSGGVSSLSILRHPLLQVLVGSLEMGEFVSSPETFPEIMKRSFDFPFDPGRVGRGDDGFEPVVYGEIDQRLGKLRFPFDDLNEDVLHSVVEYFERNSSEGCECPLVRFQERGQVALFEEFCVDCA